MRLDGEGVRALLDAGSEVLGAGNPQGSGLLARVKHGDPALRMPPPEAKLDLTADQLDVLEDWIRAGAPVEAHWSLRPMVASGVGVDQAIERTARAQGLDLAPPASRETWLRRASFVLTGLPPTLGELRAFLENPGEEAFENEVERLLASPRFGERMAVDWMDVARYADTYGYQADVERAVWPWRDWVIEAFNSGMGYDEFVRLQLAGDLLPEATQEQILPTAFQRLHRQTNEGGSVEEEFRLEYVGDRTHTFGTAFMGLTLECARCHDHKFDPISQREYFALSSFFANIDESGLYSHFTNATPTPALTLVEPEEREEFALSKSVHSLVEGGWRGVSIPRPRLEGWYPLDQVGQEGALENFVEEGPAGKAHGELVIEDGALAFNGDRPAHFPEVGIRRRYEPASFGVRLWIPKSMDRAVVLHRSKAWHDSGSRGYQVLIEDGRLSASWIHFWPGDAISVVTEHELPVAQWVHISVAYDGSSHASGLRVWVDGEEAATHVVRDHLTRKIVGGAEEHLTLGERFRDRGFRGGRMRDLMVFHGAISTDVAQVIAQPDVSQDDVASALARPAELVVSAEDQADFMERRRSLAERIDSLPQIMVMQEMAEPRPTHVLVRGSYLTPAEQVQPGVPAALPPWPEGAPPNRLGLAQWLLDPDHPLTARVAVNRLWQLVFGRGLVETSDDFGVQGTPPSHPELLDQLALEFVASGWDTKAMLRRLILSNTFRRSSDPGVRGGELDPDNRWLARGPKVRLSAEALRDAALALGGLLVEEIGGPPVRPYQPPGLWKEVSGKEYVPSSGDGLYRRSLYTIWKRTVAPPPAMAAHGRRRPRGVLGREPAAPRAPPLQALTLLNETAVRRGQPGLCLSASRITGADGRHPHPSTPSSSSSGPANPSRRSLPIFKDALEFYLLADLRDRVHRGGRCRRGPPLHRRLHHRTPRFAGGRTSRTRRLDLCCSNILLATSDETMVLR